MNIEDITVGDTIDFERIVIDVPNGQTIVTAWLTIKEHYDQTDDDAVIQKRVTTTTSASGYITNATNTATLVFQLSVSDTSALYANAEYVYDIQVKTNSDTISTLESGIITFNPQVTRSNV